MRPLATHVAWSVCLSVGHNRVPCKTAEPIKMPFGLWNRVGRRNRISGGDPHRKGNNGDMSRSIVIYTERIYSEL